MKNLILVLPIFLIATSCLTIIPDRFQNPVHYLGETFPPTEQVDVFYNFGDVEKEFKVIGKISNDAGATYSIEKAKEKMIALAKEKGGDAIIFLNLDVESIELDRRIAIAAEVLRYKDE